MEYDSRYFFFSMLIIVTTMTLYGLQMQGSVPVNYCPAGFENSQCSSEIKLYANRLDSTNSSVSHGYDQFDFCQSSNGTALERNLGQILLGDRILPTPFEINFSENRTCVPLCKKSYKKSDPSSMQRLDLLLKGVLQKYRHHWIVDETPVNWCYFEDATSKSCSEAFPIGCFNEDERSSLCKFRTDYDRNRGFCDRYPEYHESRGLCNFYPSFDKLNTFYVLNHFHLNITYNKADRDEWGSSFVEQGGRIISVRVSPSSVKHRYSDDGETLHCDTNEAMTLPSNKGELDDETDITYSYDITFQEIDQRWASRWDFIPEPILKTPLHFENHSMYTLGYLILLSWVLYRILFRSLRYEIDEAYKLEAAVSDANSKHPNEVIFRPPKNGMLLAALSGTGVHLLLMTLTTLSFAGLGFFPPGDRGSLMTWAISIYVSFASVSGYVSARICKSFGDMRWKANAALTALLCPGVFFWMLMLVNIVQWFQESSSVIPISTLSLLVVLWLGIALPFTFLGAHLGVKEQPGCPNTPYKMPRYTLPFAPPSWFVQYMVVGSLGYIGISSQFLYIWNSIWLSFTYRMYWSLFLEVVILMIICSETTIILCYLYLTIDDFQWWWRAFLTSGSSTIWLALHSYSFYSFSGPASFLLYFGYTLMTLFLYFIMTGAVGFLACFWFVSRIEPLDDPILLKL